MSIEMEKYSMKNKTHTAIHALILIIPFKNALRPLIYFPKIFHYTVVNPMAGDLRFSESVEKSFSIF